MSSSTSNNNKSSSSATTSYNSSIPNHFAVMCVMEDLIGSPDAESEEAIIESRARAVSQLSGLANTMGRDWCENEIIPYLMRLALEDEKSVSVAATRQICDLCETKYFSKSIGMQESLILSVGVAFMTSEHSDVRSSCFDSVRRACIIFAKNTYFLNQKQQSGSNSTNIPHQQNHLLQPQEQELIQKDACRLLLRVIHALLFDTSYPTSIASGLILLSPSAVELSAALPPFQLKPISFYLRDSMDKIEELFSPDSLLTQLRLETAVCGGTGRVLVIDDAIVTLATNLLLLAQQGSSVSSHAGADDEIQDVFFALDHLIDYLLHHVFSASCPSAIFMDKTLSKLSSWLTSLANYYSSSSLRNKKQSSSSSFLSLVERVELNISSIFSKIICDWSHCEDWAVRFEIAKFSADIFDSLLRLFTEIISSNTMNERKNNKFIFLELSMELYQRVLPVLVNDNEVEVNRAAAGALPNLVSSFEKFSSSPIARNLNIAASASSSLLIRQTFSSQNEKFSQQLSVQEAVANSLGESMKGGTSTATTKSENITNSKNDNNNDVVSSLAETAQSTLSEMLSTCEDDGVRVSIVESLLWSTVVTTASSSTSSPVLKGDFKHSLSAALDRLTDTPHSTATCNPEIPQTTVTSWRIREQLGEATGKMITKLLLNGRIIDFSPPVVDFVINPFVRLLFDRFYQVRLSCLHQLVSFHQQQKHQQVSSSTVKISSTSSTTSTKPDIPILWNWILQFKPAASRAPHYQTRIAFISAALVCASERELVLILESASNDKVVNVRRAVALALTQGNASVLLSSTSTANSNNQQENKTKKDYEEESQEDKKNSSSLEKFMLLPGFQFSWSKNVDRKVFDLLEKLVSDQSADVREVAVAGLSKCS